MFQKATKKAAKLKLALEGTSGTGKTFSALKMATAILKAMTADGQDTGNGRIALIDSEHGSAALYAHLFDFDHAVLEEFSLPTYMKALGAAKEQGYPMVIIDSMSHAWNGKGGALETVDRMGGSKFTNGWKAVTPLQTQFINTILAYPGHVIATLRTKMEYVIEKDEHTGKIGPKKVGLAPIQREGVDYEFSVVLDLAQGGNMTVTKSRCDTIVPFSVLKWTDVDAIAERLMKWLGDGAAVTPLDALTDDIRFATSRTGLIALAPRFMALTPEQQAGLKDMYRARVMEFPDQGDV